MFSIWINCYRHKDVHWINSTGQLIEVWKPPKWDRIFRIISICNHVAEMVLKKFVIPFPHFPRICCWQIPVPLSLCRRALKLLLTVSAPWELIPSQDSIILETVLKGWIFLICCMTNSLDYMVVVLYISSLGDIYWNFDYVEYNRLNISSFKRDFCCSQKFEKIIMAKNVGNNFMWLFFIIFLDYEEKSV